MNMMILGLIVTGLYYVLFTVYKLTLKHLIFYFSNKFSKSIIFANISTLTKVHCGILKSNKTK